jgi:hypothetical protein
MLDVNEISLKINKEVWKIVSYLISCNVVKTRSESRGYDIYQLSDEYKERCKKK